MLVPYSPRWQIVLLKIGLRIELTRADRRGTGEDETSILVCIHDALKKKKKIRAGWVQVVV
jgi:hypothetical protein